MFLNLRNIQESPGRSCVWGLRVASLGFRVAVCRNWGSLFTSPAPLESWIVQVFGLVLGVEEGLRCKSQVGFNICKPRGLRTIDLISDLGLANRSCFWKRPNSDLVFLYWSLGLFWGWGFRAWGLPDHVNHPCYLCDSCSAITLATSLLLRLLALLARTTAPVSWRVGGSYFRNV